jgi:hypothetical protein
MPDDAFPFDLGPLIHQTAEIISALDRARAAVGDYHGLLCDLRDGRPGPDPAARCRRAVAALEGALGPGALGPAAAALAGRLKAAGSN